MRRQKSLIFVFTGLIFAFLGYTAPLLAQNTVSGQVISNGQPLPGVNILVMGTSTGTATNAKGHYSLNVSSLEDTLRFSFIGYKTQMIPISNRQTINVVMKSSIIGGQQLIVVGYGKQKKENVTGAISSVNTKNLKSQPVGEVTKQLQGNVSGVSVLAGGMPGNQATIHIRGFNTFGNNNPLYVVDGVPTEDISTLNPNNIQSMQVLKDAGAASIYGSRASNGVIIITTKKGIKGTHVSFDGYYGFQQPPQGNVLNLLNPTGMMKLTKQALINRYGAKQVNNMTDPSYGPWSNPSLPDYLTPVGAKKGYPSVNPKLYHVNPHYKNSGALANFYRIVRANKQGTDWFHKVFKTKPTMNGDLTVSGGNNQRNYLFSSDYRFDDGTELYSYLRRYSLRANSNFNVNDHIRVGENLAYSFSQNPQNRAGLGVIIRPPRPIISVYDIMGNFAGTYGGWGNGENYYADAYRDRNNNSQGNRLFGNIYATVDILHNVTLKTRFGADLRSHNSHSFTYPTWENTENSSINSYQKSSDNSNRWTWINTLTYQSTFRNAHNMEVELGTETHHENGSHLQGATRDFFSFNPDFVNLNSGSGVVMNGSSKFASALFSLFGRVNYNYKSKYLLSFTIRRDGSSKFINHKYGIFPAISAGWRISSEKFMQGISWLTNLKIRGSWGIMGNQLNVPSDNGYSLYAFNKATSYYDIKGTSNSVVSGLRQSQIGAPNAKWEGDVSSDIGVDAALFNGKLQATIDFYRKQVRNLLYNPDLPATVSSAAPPYINVGKMRNQGIDLSLKGNTNITSNLSFNSMLTFTTYQNKILHIAKGVNYFGDVNLRFSQSVIRNEVGHPISSFYGYKISGFWDSQSEINAADASAPSGIYQSGEGLGRFRYKDVNGDGQITSADRTFIGNPSPSFSYGLNVGLNYRNFDFSLFLYGVQGNDIFDYLKWWTDFYASFKNAKSKVALYNSWTPQNHHAKAPVQEANSSFSTNGVPNSYYIENGSYLKAKSIMLGYTLPSNIVNTLGMRKLRIYVQATNLFTITNYPGIDPATVGRGGTISTTAHGIDYGRYPTPRKFLVGVNLSF